VHVGGLEDAHLESGSKDVVFMGDVLEHVPDPAATLREVARILAPGGALALRGPLTTNSFARRLGLGAMESFKKRLVLNEPPYHLWEFEPDTLTKLVHGAGFELESLKQSKTAPSFAKRKGAGALAVAALDTLNLTWTNLTGSAGDRCTLVARK
jgi:2-polyprenyl-3-methyl-5-hydroxy-6-metoxy-1,4-benzoquinol methylase